MVKVKQQVIRRVPPMDEAIYFDGYRWLLNHSEETQLYLKCTEESVEQGFSPDEIYRHTLNVAGYHRREIAERCRNAAHYLTSIAG